MRTSEKTFPWKLICIGGPKDGLKKRIGRPSKHGCEIFIDQQPEGDWLCSRYHYAHIDRERRIVVGIHVQKGRVTLTDYIQQAFEKS